ncbi:ATP-dependent zinc metalloprotease FtsH [Candidatus Woesebacteria bacterium]|nr:ATP-dependent zinc metalloprotease FtsH [Candidatus Woesebacteria bacterium]
MEQKSTKKAKNKKKANNQQVKEFKIKIDVRMLFIAVFVILFLLSLFTNFGNFQNIDAKEESLTKILKDIKQDKVKNVIVEDNRVTAEYKDDTTVFAFKESADSFREVLKDAEIPLDAVNVTTKDTRTSIEIMSLIGNIVPALLFVGFFIFMFRQARGAQDSVFSFGQSKAKRFNKSKSQITFKDVAGVEEAKKELEEIVDFLKYPKKYRKLGARPPKGVILVGPAGTGKTLLAKAVAGEANVPFFSIAGSEFMEMLVGIGAARVRDLFTNAKKNAPSIIFIDEIDAIGRARSRGVMPAHDEREQTLNQILVEMDGFTPNEQVVIVAATNRGDLLDPALLRPGRFDRRIIVDYPDVEGRGAIIAIHARNKPLAKNVKMERIAKRTVGFSGADIENMLNEAAITAARNDRDVITMEDIEEAATKVKLGPEKKRLQSDFDRKITAYHEAGHAIASHFQEHTDAVHRVSIVSRGMALGYTLIPPAKDKLHETKSHLLERLAVMMGGRAAEETVFNEITTGAANDFDQATQVAKNMVMEYGMSALGPINFGPTQDITEWGRSYWEQNSVSDETMAKIDAEVKTILETAYKKAKKLIATKRKELDAVAEALIKHENLDQDQFEKIVGKKSTQKAN